MVPEREHDLDPLDLLGRKSVPRTDGQRGVDGPVRVIARRILLEAHARRNHAVGRATIFDTQLGLVLSADTSLEEPALAGHVGTARSHTGSTRWGPGGIEGGETS